MNKVFIDNIKKIPRRLTAARDFFCLTLIYFFFKVTVRKSIIITANY